MNTGTSFVVFTLICCITIIIMQLLNRNTKKSIKKEIDLKKLLPNDKSIMRYDVVKLIVYSDNQMQVEAFDYEDDGYPG